MKDKNKMAVLYSLLAFSYIFPSVGICAIAISSLNDNPTSKGSETAEEKAHEQQHNGSNVENGFSPVSPELSKQVTNQSKIVTINFCHHKV